MRHADRRTIPLLPALLRAGLLAGLLAALPAGLPAVGAAPARAQDLPAAPGDGSSDAPLSPGAPTRDSGAATGGGNGAEPIAAEPIAAEPIAAGDVAARVGAAGAAAEAGDPERAVELYEEVLRTTASGGSDLHLGHLYYNLGGVLLESGHLGRAIAAYRESRLRLPRDPDVAANLRLARGRVVDDLPPPEASALARRLLPWHHALSRRELAALTAFLNLLFWSLLAVRVFAPPKAAGARRAWAVGLALTLVATVVCGTSLAVRLLAPGRVAVILPEEVSARAEPAPGGEVRFELHAGSELRVEEGDRGDGWLEVQLPDGESGWLPREQVALAPR